MKWMPLGTRVLLLLTLSIGWGLDVSPLVAADPPADSVDRDYSEELPRIKPTEPDQALKTFRVAAGFRVDLVAAEPLVTDPIAIAFDEDSRLFVIEMRDYSEQETEKLGRVRLLEDTDSDGRFDKSTIFASGLSWPTAITCWAGGVFVGAAPDIFYLKDTDGDGKADVQQLVLTGFSRGNVQGLLNTFKWGLDNRIHGATSSSGAAVVPGPDHPSLGDKSASLPLRGRDFAIDPRSLGIEPTSGGGQHGLSFNQWGEKFVCSNSNHIQYVLFEDRYLARNPYLAAPSPRAMIAADGPQADVFRTSPVEPWRVVRTRLRVKGIVPGPVEGGGTAAGYFTGATGVTIYRGNAWPAEFYGWAIIGDVGSNLVHRKRLEPIGIGYVARRVDEKTEFVSSTDIWFRPVQFANAPDGALYIADMYREVIEHPKSLPPVIKKHLDLTSGRDRGRIYRIVPEGFKQPELPRLGRAKTSVLAGMLQHTNGWHRETASRLLYERQDKSAVPLLEVLAGGASTAEGRIHALYALDGLDALTADVVLKCLDDAFPRVREHAVRLAESIAGNSPTVREHLFAMTADKDLRVRYQLAFTLGELKDPRRFNALADILRRDAADPNIRLAARSSLAEGAGTVLASLAGDKQFRKSKVGADVLRDLAAQIGRQQRAGDVAEVIKTLVSLSAGEPAVSTAIVQGLAPKQGSDLQKEIAAATGGRADELIKRLIDEASAKALDAEVSPPERVAAVSQLQLGSYDRLAPLFQKLLAPTQPAEVQTSALETLARFDAPEIAALLIGSWQQLSPRMRARAGDVLFSRSPWVAQLLDAIDGQRISPADLEPGRLKQLAAH